MNVIVDLKYGVKTMTHKKLYRVDVKLVNKIAETYNKDKGDVLTDILSMESIIFHKEQAKNLNIPFCSTYYKLASGKVIDNYKHLKTFGTYLL
jgi:hypothetical protein